MEKDDYCVVLRPKDYLVTAGGLRLENITEDMVFEVQIDKIIMWPLKVEAMEEKDAA